MEIKLIFGYGMHNEIKIIKKDERGLVCVYYMLQIILKQGCDYLRVYLM